MLDVMGHQGVELFHGHSATLAAGLTLASLGRAGVVAIPAALAGAQRHGHAAGGAEAEARPKGCAADDVRRGQRRATGLEQRLHGVELGHLDDRRHRHLDHLSLRLPLARLPELGVEAAAADKSRAGQHLVDGVDAPSARRPL